MPNALDLIAENKRTKAKSLNLARCGLSELPEELFELTHLEELIVSNRIWDDENDCWIMMREHGAFNRLTKLSPKIAELENLEVLHMGGSGNIYDPISELEISQWGYFYVGEHSFIFNDYWDLDDSCIKWISNLSKLKVLNLAYTKFRTLLILSNLLDLTHLDLNSSSIEDISCLSMLPNIMQLNLSRTRSGYFSVLQNISKLKVLNLSHTRVFDLKVLGILHNLEKLYLRSTDIDELRILSEFPRLTSLFIDRSNLVNISHLEKIFELRELGLGGIPIEDISCVKKLSKIEVLDINNTRVEDFEVIQELQNLKKINLDGTRFSKIDLLKNLNALTSLNLRSTQVGNLYRIRDLKRLRALNLKSVKTSDTTVFENFPKLEALNLEGTDFRDFSFFSGLLNIQNLNLSFTKFSNLAQLEPLSQLKVLNLSKTSVGDFSCLVKFKNLQILNLEYTNIGDLTEIESLNQLQLLNLNKTKIEDFKKIEKLHRLQILELQSAKIKDISSVKKLSRLQSLNLKSSNVSDILFLRGLDQLQNLNLSDTYLEDFSSVNKLPRLQTLNLHRTKVRDISFVKNIEDLIKLDLRKCKVSNISSLRKFISKGIEIEWREYETEGINVYGCPLEFPPPEIVQQGNEAILNYFKELEKGEVTVQEAKLLILGEGGTGKTTFARKIQDCHAPMPDQEEDTTRGINIEQYHLKTPGQEDFCMNIWDFGGQAIYHSTHQFFLSKRSLYVLILDGRIEENPHYWLQVQQLLGKDSPLLLVLNKKGEIRQDIALQELRGDYQNLKELYELSLKEDYPQIEKLSQAVEYHIRNLPHFLRGEKLPKLWVDIRQKIEERAAIDPYIDQKAFRKICKDAGIAERDRQDFLDDYLHDLGVMLHFREEPMLKNMVILQPAWATEAVYKVLDHTKEQEPKGYFHKSALDELWGTEAYLDVFEELLALMQKFELCYALPNSEEYVVPQLLSHDVPKGYEWKTEQGQLQLRLQYDFMPKGILTRLIVRLHDLIVHQDLVWRRGVVFFMGDSRAEVLEHFRDERIHIKAQGSKAKELLTIIARELDIINATFEFGEDKEMEVHVMVPCICHQCARTEKPYFFPKKMLDNAKAQGVNQVQCQNSFQSVSVASLLDAVFVRDTSDLNFQPNKNNQPMAEKKLTQYDLIKKLIALNEYEAVFEQLTEIVEGDSRSENMIISFQSRYNRLENDIAKGILSRDDSEIDFNRLNNNITSFMDSHQKKAAFMATVPRISDNPGASPKNEKVVQVINKFYGDIHIGDRNTTNTTNNFGDNAHVGDRTTNTTNNFGDNTQVGDRNTTYGDNAITGDGNTVYQGNVDNRSFGDNAVVDNQLAEGAQININITNTRNEFQESIPQIEALVEEEQKHGFITQEEYEELMDILADIQENAEPKNERQEKKWKRWLGKALSAGEKLTSTAATAAVGAGVKEWVSKGGLQVLGKFIGIL